MRADLPHHVIAGQETKIDVMFFARSVGNSEIDLEACNDQMKSEKLPPEPQPSDLEKDVQKNNDKIRSDHQSAKKTWRRKMQRKKKGRAFLEKSRRRKRKKKSKSGTSTNLKHTTTSSNNGDAVRNALEK